MGKLKAPASGGNDAEHRNPEDASSTLMTPDSCLHPADGRRHGNADHFVNNLEFRLDGYHVTAPIDTGAD